MAERRASRRVIFYAFLLVIAIMLAITSLGLSRIRNLASDLESVVQERDVQIALMHSMRSAARDRSITLQSMMIIKDPFTIDDYAMQMSEAASHYLQAREKLLQHGLTAQERDLLERQHRQTVQTGSSQNQIIDYIRNENYPPAAPLLIYTTLPSQRLAMAMMDEFIALKRSQNLDSLNTTSIYIEQTYRLMILLGIIGVMFSIGVAYFVSRRINREIALRQTSEQELRHFNQDLERRVLERTTELANTNDKLRHEINERVKVQYELTHLATHDSLTELPNRAMFNEHMDIMLYHAARHHRQVALLFMDLDGFKAVNDTYGHDAGDKLLIEIAKRMRTCVRKEDIVARMGGDEFTILLGELQENDDARIVAEKLIRVVNEPVHIGEFQCNIGISIGISLFPHNARDADSLLRLADDAMYAAKDEGKNTYCFSSNSVMTPEPPTLSTST